MHTSGLGYGPANADLDLGDAGQTGAAPEILRGASLEALVERLASEPLRLPPAPRLPVGGGGLVSTAPDYLRFAQMLANDGELGPAATRPSARPGGSCGAGPPRRPSGSTPAEDLVVVFMTQLVPSDTFNFHGQLKALVYPAIAD